MHHDEVARIWYLSPSNLPSFQAHYSMAQSDLSSFQFSSLFRSFSTFDSRMYADCYPSPCYNTNSAAERRKRRMISNRESARRSRMRQQKQFNQLWSLVIHFQSVNHQLLQKVNNMMKECHHILHENIKLRDEKLELLKELENLAAEYNCVSQA
ncbi:hypothetical protein BHE74_00002067 [Ensete ventricosum]|nr:hypothetical protein BHE74_00002067 [Ensete ventricosum]RZR79443.1 hypothetical protein BHM03_00005166 [Ensete ventricosum]